MHIPIFEQQMLVDLKKLMFLQAVWKYTQIILSNMRPIRLSQILTGLATQQLSGKDPQKKIIAKIWFGFFIEIRLLRKIVAFL